LVLNKPHSVELASSTIPFVFMKNLHPPTAFLFFARHSRAAIDPDPSTLLAKSHYLTDRNISYQKHHTIGFSKTNI
jgi:hypothetical protein